MRHAFTIGAAAVAMGAGLSLGATPTADATPPETTTTRTATPDVALFRSIYDDPRTPGCDVEDGSDLSRVGQVCRWDASEDGNGVGESFVVLAIRDGLSPSDVGLLYLYADGRFEL